MDPFVVSLVSCGSCPEDEETQATFEVEGDEAVAAVVKLLSREARVIAGRAYVKVRFGVLIYASGKPPIGTLSIVPEGEE